MPPSEQPAVVRLVDPAQAGAVSEVIAEAFAELAVVGWLVPDSGARRRVLAADFCILVEHAFAHGEVHATSGLDAVAVWFPLDSGPLPPPVDYERRVAAAVGR